MKSGERARLRQGVLRRNICTAALTATLNSVKCLPDQHRGRTILPVGHYRRSAAADMVAQRRDKVKIPGSYVGINSGVPYA
jgi:hypothetical protein